MASVHQLKNETRRRYRAALRSDQPKEVIVKLAAKYHHLVRQHNSIRKQKNAAELYDEVRRENVLITSGHLHPTC